MEKYPLRLGDVSPGDHFVRIALPRLRVVPFSYPPDQMTRDQVLLVERMVRTVNEQWWWVNDDLNIAFDESSHPILLDLSNAQRANPLTAQGCERPREEQCFEEWAELVAGHGDLVRVRRSARHFVSSICWAKSEYASGRSEPRRWVYAAERLLPLEMEIALDCRVCPCEREGLSIRSWCIASGPLADTVVKTYGLQLGWTPLQYKEGKSCDSFPQWTVFPSSCGLQDAAVLIRYTCLRE